MRKLKFKYFERKTKKIYQAERIDFKKGIVFLNPITEDEGQSMGIIYGK